MSRRDGFVRLQARAKDPSAVLAKLSESRIVSLARLEPLVNQTPEGEQGFVLTAVQMQSLSDLPEPPLAQSVDPGKLLLERVRGVLDERLAGKCRIISWQNFVGNMLPDPTRSVSLALRWRCALSVAELLPAIRELETGKPGVKLSGFGLAPGDPRVLGVADGSAPKLDVRFTASAALPR